MSFENPALPQENTPEDAEIPLREKVSIPHIEPIVDIFEKFERDSKSEIEPVSSETVREVLNSFFEQAIENTQIFSSERYGVKMPWTMFDTGALAKKLYEHFGGTLPEELQTADIQEVQNEEESETDEDGPVKNKREFVFGSFQLPQHGNEFTFMEEALHQVIKDIPHAIQSIENGEEPQSNKIYNVGSPTNELGEMNAEFIEAMKGEKAFNQFGKLYAEFVEEKVKQEVSEDTTIFLKGFSMGAALAGETGKNLISEGAATQSREEAQEKHIPFLQVRLDTTPASSDLSKETKRWRIPGGFILEGAVAFLTSPYVNQTSRPDKDRKFLSSVNAVLHEKGIDPNMSAKQTALKKQALSVIIDNLRNGVPLPKDLKVTEVVGTFDPLTFADNKRRKLQKQKRDHKDSLGENIVSETENKRTFGINMRHTVPFMRENEMRRLYKAAQALEGLQKKDK